MIFSKHLVELIKYKIYRYVIKMMNINRECAILNICCWHDVKSN